MSSKLTLDYEGIGEMLRAAFMQEEMHRRATVGKEFAEATAPFDSRDTTLAHYKELFRVENEPRKDRACASLINDDPAAFQIEFGTGHSPAHYTLTRALDIMGAG